MWIRPSEPPSGVTGSPGLVPEHRAERGEHARPAVGAGRPAERQDDPLRLELQRGTDGVAQSGRGGRQRGRACRRAGCAARRCWRPRRRRWRRRRRSRRSGVPRWPRHVDLDGPEACRRPRRRRCRRRRRPAGAVVVDAALLQPAAQVVGDLGSGEAALELVGCDEDFHRVSCLRCRRSSGRRAVSRRPRCHDRSARCGVDPVPARPRRGARTPAPGGTASPSVRAARRCAAWSWWSSSSLVSTGQRVGGRVELAGRPAPARGSARGGPGRRRRPGPTWRRTGSRPRCR